MVFHVAACSGFFLLGCPPSFSGVFFVSCHVSPFWIACHLPSSPCPLGSSYFRVLCLLFSLYGRILLSLQFLVVLCVWLIEPSCFVPLQGLLSFFSDSRLSCVPHSYKPFVCSFIALVAVNVLLFSLENAFPAEPFNQDATLCSFFKV